MAILRQILFCIGMFRALKHGFRSLANLKLEVNVVGRTLNRKEQLRYRAVSLRQHRFLVLCGRPVGRINLLYYYGGMIRDGIK